MSFARWFGLGWGVFVAVLGTQRDTRIRWIGESKEKGRLLTWPVRIAVVAGGLGVATAAFFGWF